MKEILSRANQEGKAASIGKAPEKITVSTMNSSVGADSGGTSSWKSTWENMVIGHGVTTSEDNVKLKGLSSYSFI